jgi:hypothetical protein
MGRGFLDTYPEAIDERAKGSAVETPNMGIPPSTSTRAGNLHEGVMTRSP